MTYLRRASALLLAVCGLPLTAQTPTFTANVNLVRVVATVKDNYGKLVGSLNKEDFQIYDNEAKQDIALFAKQTDQPVSVSILIDTSGSTAKELKPESESVHRFVRTLFGPGAHRDDVAQLISFNWQVTLQVGWTSSANRIDAQLRKLKGEAGTALYDAIHFAAQQLERREGRHVIVVITDGGDTVSSYNYHRALRDAQYADAVIYPVIIMPITNDAGRNIGGENALFQLAASTGGRTFQPTIGTELDRAFTDILNDLRTQYLIGFYPKNVPLTKEPFHRLRVRTVRQDLRVSARNGYYGEVASDSGGAGGRVSVVPPQE